jgi:hypothetical protein
MRQQLRLLQIASAKEVTDTCRSHEPVVISGR